MWIQLLNEYFEDTVKIPKNQALGFVVIKPEHLKFRYETSTGKKKKAIQKRKTTLSKSNRRRLRQLGGFLNQYNFAYAGRDVVNQATKVVPDIIKAATKDINAVATDRINQIISQGVKKWCIFFLKSYGRLSRLCTKLRIGYWETLGNNNSTRSRRMY